MTINISLEKIKNMPLIDLTFPKVEEDGSHLSLEMLEDRYVKEKEEKKKKNIYERGGRGRETSQKE